MLPPKLYSLGLLCSFLLSQVSATIKTGPLKDSRVVYSSQVPLSANAALSLEVMEVSNVLIQSNGQYTDLVVSRVTKIFETVLERYTAEYFTLPASENSAFNAAYEEVITEMDIDIQVVLPTVVKRIAAKYAAIASEYNKSTKMLLPNTPEYQKRIEKAKIVLLFVQEAHANNQKFSNEQNLTFFEFIYRFIGTEPVGDRYGFAIQCLYSSLQNNNFFPFFKILTKYFDPNFVALPVFFFSFTDEKLDPLKQFFIGFLAKLYNKISILDPEEDKELYNRHACMLITSMISCTFYEDFIPLILNMIQSVDMVQLGSSPRFVRSSLELLKKTSGTDSILLDFVVGRLINDEVILALAPNNYLDHGSIINEISSSHSKFYEKYTARLSEEAVGRLFVIEQQAASYNAILSQMSLFDALERTLPTMNNQHLSTVINAVDNLITVFPDYFIHNSQESGMTLIKIVTLIPKLVKIAISKANPEFNLKRFQLMIGMVQLSLSGTVIIQSTSDAFSHVLLFYNMHLAASQDPALSDCHDKISGMLKNLIDRKNFFKTSPQRVILYNYYKNISPENADELMNLALMYNLEKSSNISFVFAENLTTGKRLGIDTSSYLINFFVREVEEYLANFAEYVTLDDYKDSKVILMAQMLIQNKLISNTEKVLINKLLNRYSSDHTSLVQIVQI